MDDSGYPTADSAHYTSGDLGAKILATLKETGTDPDHLHVEDLAQIDQLHTGGAPATRALMQRATLQPGMRVVDVGGGLGGPARLLAHETGCSVIVLDLAEEFCTVGAMLTERAGLSDRVTFMHGSALEMPFADGSFDRAWTQHATMNIPGKARLYGEIHRVLKPGGRLVMHEMMAGAKGPIRFPVPWARDPSVSFLQPSAEIRALLAGIGFHEVEWVDEREAAIASIRAQAAGTSQAGPASSAAQLVLGPQLPDMLRNVAASFEEDRLTVVQSVFERT